MVFTGVEESLRGRFFVGLIGEVLVEGKRSELENWKKIFKMLALKQKV